MGPAASELRNRCVLLHHGSGPWTHRIQGCGAIDPRSNASSPSNRLLADLAPTAFDGAAVLGTVKAALRVVAEEATSLDSSCARRLATVAGRDEETGFQIEQRNDGRKMGCAS